MKPPSGPAGPSQISKAFGASDGKGSKSELLPHRAARTSLTPGDPLSRMGGQYGKGHSYLPGASPSDSPPAQTHPGMSQIRGSMGGMRRRPRQGGLGGGVEGGITPDNQQPDPIE